MARDIVHRCRVTFFIEVTDEHQDAPPAVSSAEPDMVEPAVVAERDRAARVAVTAVVLRCGSGQDDLLSTTLRAPVSAARANTSYASMNWSRRKW